MKKYEHIKNKAIELRTNNYSLNDICEMLNVSKTTAYGWIRDVPCKIVPKIYKSGLIQGKTKNQEQAQAHREEVYKQAYVEAESLIIDPIFRDFVILYMTEGYRKCRNHVSVCNSDPSLVCLANIFIKKHCMNKVFYSLQYHVDQNFSELKNFWFETLGLDDSVKFRYNIKSNSKNLKNRNWASKYGVMSVGCSDTDLRMKIEAWMDYVKQTWNVPVFNFNYIR